MAARPGIEPGSEDSKSSVLPLHHRASGRTRGLEGASTKYMGAVGLASRQAVAFRVGVRLSAWERRRRCLRLSWTSGDASPVERITHPTAIASGRAIRMADKDGVEGVENSSTPALGEPFEANDR